MGVAAVTPGKNAGGTSARLAAEIVGALDGVVAYEIVSVDDGRDDSTEGEIRRLRKGIPQLRLVRHAKSCGQSAAIRSGVKAAGGLWIATLDGDGQHDPAHIPAL